MPQAFGGGPAQVVGDAMLEARDLTALFRARVALTPTGVAYRQFDSETNAWVDWTWAAIDAEVARWRAALAKERFEPGARVATLMVNSVGYVAVDQAALSLGLAIVPLHVTDNPGNLAYILEDCSAAALIVDNPAYWARLAPQLRDHANLKRVVVISESSDEIAADPRATRASQWLAQAQTEPAPLAALTPETLTAIVYTSGTTGRPKGVMLSHRNVVSTVLAVRQCVDATPQDVFLSFLPLSHTFERTAGYYLPIATGSVVAFCRSVAFLMEDMRATRPTILISVPRIYERAHLAFHERLATQGALARAASDIAQRLGWRRFEAAQAGATHGVTALERIAWNLFDPLVARKVRAAFGGRLRIAVAGGAPMPLAASRFFLAMGIAVHQGYGMTESSPVVSVNRIGRNVPESVGELIPNVEARIGDNDELLVRGPGVMIGYWRRPDDTKATLDAQGWLHTGDQARLDGDRVFIKGRIKDIIVTSTGEKVSPVDIEEAIGAYPLFEQVMAVGERRPFLSVVAVLNPALLAEEARRLGLTGSPQEIIDSEKLRASALTRIKRALAHFPDYATPRKVVLTLEPWTIAAGLMTPTLKLKRLAIEGAFENEIAALYAR